MDIDFKEIILAILFVGGVKAIKAATEWFKRLFTIEAPKWSLAIFPIAVGLLINVGGVAGLGYFQEFGTIAIVASIIMGFIAAFTAMDLYDDRNP
ncbi:MAG: hypothetical protein CMB80_09260 [Flammeovirgaceae bacterium]|nr:hypothetical protein [Flammeovirgaceae bacterium]|tara:strand:+ start:1442 stop:1726 length:285 start_codon:yes stop_codon:yes gene_type:complete